MQEPECKNCARLRQEAGKLKEDLDKACHGFSSYLGFWQKANQRIEELEGQLEKAKIRAVWDAPDDMTVAEFKEKHAHLIPGGEE